MSEELSIDDLRYMRVGYINNFRHVDNIIDVVTKAIPGEGTLPLRWRWGSLDKFLRRYGDLGKILWAKTASYHLLMINGHHVMRLWTDTPATCIIDLSVNVATTLVGLGFTIEDTPVSCERKCKPLFKRVRIYNVEEADKLAAAVKQTYGV